MSGSDLTNLKLSERIRHLEQVAARCCGEKTGAGEYDLKDIRNSQNNLKLCLAIHCDLPTQAAS